MNQTQAKQTTKGLSYKRLWALALVALGWILGKAGEKVIEIVMMEGVASWKGSGDAVRHTADQRPQTDDSKLRAEVGRQEHLRRQAENQVTILKRQLAEKQTKLAGLEDQRDASARQIRNHEAKVRTLGDRLASKNLALKQSGELVATLSKERNTALAKQRKAETSLVALTSRLDRAESRADRAEALLAAATRSQPKVTTAVAQTSSPQTSRPTRYYSGVTRNGGMPIRKD